MKKLKLLLVCLIVCVGASKIFATNLAEGVIDALNNKENGYRGEQVENHKYDDYSKPTSTYLLSYHGNDSSSNSSWEWLRTKSGSYAEVFGRWGKLRLRKSTKVKSEYIDYVVTFFQLTGKTCKSSFDDLGFNDNMADENIFAADKSTDGYNVLVDSNLEICGNPKHSLFIYRGSY